MSSPTVASRTLSPSVSVSSLKRPSLHGRARHTVAPHDRPPLRARPLARSLAPTAAIPPYSTRTPHHVPPRWRSPLRDPPPSRPALLLSSGACGLFSRGCRTQKPTGGARRLRGARGRTGDATSSRRTCTPGEMGTRGIESSNLYAAPIRSLSGFGVWEESVVAPMIS